MHALSVKDKLSLLGEEQLLQGWDRLNLVQKREIHAQIDALDGDLLRELKRLVLEAQPSRAEHYEPWTEWYQAGSQRDRERGQAQIAAGHCGCLLVAGGQGSRLGFDGPKGMYPLTPFKRKTLFQRMAERVLAASDQAGCALPLAIMTAPTNDAATRAYFQEHQFFGLTEEQVSFFMQGMWPLLDENAHLFLEGPGRIAMGPDGNGVALKHFYNSGLWQAWHERGIRYLSFIQIDNALADPYDAELIGCHMRTGAEVTVKATSRTDPDEKVGLLVKVNGKLQVVEYTEMSSTDRFATLPKGQLLHACANLSLFCFSMDFVSRVAPASLPFHVAHKAAKSVHGERMAWKFEHFIFDVLPLANHTTTILYPREQCFAPLKNRSGPDSVTTVQEALLRYDREIFSRLTGAALPDDLLLELSPRFYYPTAATLARWQRRSAPQSGYLEV